MIAASLLFYPLKIFLFVLYPTILTVRALQYKKEKNEEQQNTRKQSILLLALIYVAFSIIENMFSDFDNKFFLLTLLMIGGMMAKEKGYLKRGLQELTLLINKLKHQ